VPEQRCPGEPGPDHHHTRSAFDVYATGHLYYLPPGMPHLFARIDSFESISFRKKALGESLYKTRART
jgi:hypothetical protein